MKIYVINLEERLDRLARFQQQMEPTGLSYTVLNAIRGRPGWRGCAKSHLSALEIAKNKRWDDDYHKFLILEDDVEFLTGDWYRELLKILMHTPLGWDILYLGASPQAKLEKYNDYLWVAKNCITTHAMLFNNHKHGVIDYILSCKDEIQKIDVFYMTEIQERFKCFLCQPMLASQWDNNSDTCKRSDTGTIVKNFTRFTQ